MTVDKNMKLPDLILSTILLSKTDVDLKFFLAKKAQSWNSVTLKVGVALEFSLQLANHKQQWSDFGIVCKANNGNLAIGLLLSDIFGQKEGTTILERVAFLLCLSIIADLDLYHGNNTQNILLNNY